MTPAPPPARRVGPANPRRSTVTTLDPPHQRQAVDEETSMDSPCTHATPEIEAGDPTVTCGDADQLTGGRR